VRLADHLEAVVGGEDRRQGLREETVVVGDQDADLVRDERRLPREEFFMILQDFPPKR
jgi:hypothetical protein